MKTAARNKTNIVFTRKYDLNLSNKLVKCPIWSIALHNAVIWSHRKVFV